jgi:hypothetical protein
VIDRWSLIVLGGEFLASLARPGLTLENLDTISGSIDALTFSLDDVSTAAIQHSSIVDSSHRLGFFSGAALEATLETDEQAISFQRVRVRGVRPITDAPSCYVSLSKRENQSAAVSYSAETAIDGNGLCAANVSTRQARARLRIPAGTVWSFAAGVDPDFVQEGVR